MSAAWMPCALSELSHSGYERVEYPSRQEGLEGELHTRVAPDDISSTGTVGRQRVGDDVGDAFGRDGRARAARDERAERFDRGLVERTQLRREGQSLGALDALVAQRCPDGPGFDQHDFDL